MVDSSGGLSISIGRSVTIRVDSLGSIGRPGQWQAFKDTVGRQLLIFSTHVTKRGMLTCNTGPVHRYLSKFSNRLSVFEVHQM